MLVGAGGWKPSWSRARRWRDQPLTTLSAWGDRSATWLDPVKAAEIRAANQGLPGDVRAAASAASARDVRAPNFFAVDGKGEPGRPQ